MTPTFPFRKILQDLVRSGDRCTVRLKFKASAVTEQGASEGPIGLDGKVVHVDLPDQQYPGGPIIDCPALITVEGSAILERRGEGKIAGIISVYFTEDSIFTIDVFRESRIAVAGLDVVGLRK